MRKTVVLCVTFFSVRALAQVPPESVPTGSRVVQLPLSGRPAQNGAYQGSVPSAQAPGPAIALSLDDAVKRGLQSNLGTLFYQQALRREQGIERTERANLLPQISSALTATEQQTDLAALGFGSFPSVGSAAFPTVIGPFHYFDLRAGLSQSLLDLTRLKNYRASQANVSAVRFAADDARDVIVLAVVSAYLQVVSDSARIESVRAQLATAQASYQQAQDRHTAGLTPRIDATRSQVELQTVQQRLTAVENDFAKLKLNLARLIGLPPGQDFTLTDAIPFAPLTNITLDQALLRAYANRADLKSAEQQVRAAEIAKQAAEAERLPTIQIAGDYGLIGTDPTNSHGTFGVTGAIRFPIWQGGRIRGDVQQADATLQQRRSEYQDLRGRIDAEIRSAMLDLNSAATQVTVAQSNRELARDTLTQARDRFAAGVADTLEVVQAQEAVANAEQDYISSLFNHNVAKATLARAMGQAAENIRQFIGRP